MTLENEIAVSDNQRQHVLEINRSAERELDQRHEDRDEEQKRQELDVSVTRPPRRCPHEDHRGSRSQQKQQLPEWIHEERVDVSQ